MNSPTNRAIQISGISSDCAPKCPSNRERIRIGPTYIDKVCFSGALERIEMMLSSRNHRAQTVIAVNAQVLDVARADVDFAAVVAAADMVIPDGMSLVFASRVLGKPLPERVTGVDLMLSICEMAAGSEKSVYFLGGKPGAAEETAHRLRELYPHLRIAGIDCPPLGFENSQIQSRTVIEAIQQARPDILLVAFGAPKQEFWMERFADVLPVSVMIAVGGSFDMIAGHFPRAPRWIRNAGFEWLFRLCCEPRRLWKRYLFGNVRFVWIVASQWFRESVLTRHRVSSD